MKSPLFHLGVACLITISVCAGYGLWYAAVSSKSTAVADLQNQIVAKTETMSRTASAREALLEIAGDQTAMQNYFIPETGVVSFIDWLETKGRVQGSVVNVSSVSTGTVGTQPTLSLSLTISGSFDAVMRTIGIIEYAPYDLAISEFSLVHNDKSVWNAELKLVVGSTKSPTNTP